MQEAERSSMTRLSKSLILKWVREANCIETPTLKRYFKSVWVGEEMKQQIDKSRQKMNM
jgi:hypothetical protein